MPVPAFGAAAGFCSFITIQKGTTAMASNLGQGMITDGHADPRSARAVERRREMCAEDAAEVKRIAGHLLMTLRRPPTIEEELRAELIGRTATKIRRLAEKRRDDLAERRLLEDLLRTPFNAPACTLGPRVEGSGQTYFVAEKGETCLPPDTAPAVTIGGDEPAPVADGTAA
jgi:hypothetical protein